ncbi:MAG: AbrB/MazE/SpoVT family DNA-binding domain-containing protein [Candidatus Andersenbacteria bacterium]
MHGRFSHHNKKFYGTTTIGEKGQLVIPQEAREALKVQKGEKLLVFGIGEEMVVLSKLSHMEKFVAHLTKKADEIKKIIDQAHA